MALIENLLNGERTSLEAELAATPEPSNYVRVVINKTLDHIGRMKQLTGEDVNDYRLRLNIICQLAPAGKWSTSFFAQLASAVASDHGESIKGGNGRSDS